MGQVDAAMQCSISRVYTCLHHHLTINTTTNVDQDFSEVSFSRFTCKHVSHPSNNSNSQNCSVTKLQHIVHGSTKHHSSLITIHDICITGAAIWTIFFTCNFPYTSFLCCSSCWLKVNFILRISYMGIQVDSEWKEVSVQLDATTLSRVLCALCWIWSAVGTSRSSLTISVVIGAVQYIGSCRTWVTLHMHSTDQSIKQAKRNLCQYW